MEGTAQEMGPRRHLLAYCRLLLSADADSVARTGLLGLVALHFCMDMCIGGHHREFYSSERTLQFGDLLLRWYGTLGARGFQTTDRFCIGSRRDMVDCRGRLLHYGSRLLLTQQTQIHALHLPLLCAGRVCLSHHRRMGRADGLSIAYEKRVTEATP